MIKGIGTDIIEIERIAKAIEKRGEHFISRLFTPREQKRDEGDAATFVSSYYAGRFAAKEAIAKAFGTGFRGVDWLDLEIINDELGKPVIHLSADLQVRFQNPKLHLSISHSKNYATSVCIWEE